MKAKNILLAGVLMTAMLFTACGSKSNEDVATTGNETVGETVTETQNVSSAEESTASNDVTVTYELSGYSEDEKTAYICGYKLNGGDEIDVLEFPEEVDGYSILGIEGGLAGKGAKKIVINNSCITKLDDNVLSAKQDLEEVEIDGVTTIGETALYECSNLKKVYLGDGLTELGIGIVGKCEKLEEIHVPASLTAEGCDFGNMGLSYCPNVVIYTPAGSDMEAWANENGFKVVNE